MYGATSSQDKCRVLGMEKFPGFPEDEVNSYRCMEAYA